MVLNVRLVVIWLKREAVILRERERGWEGGVRGDGESAGHLCRFCPAVFQVGARGGLYVLGLAGQDGSPMGTDNPIVSLGHPDMEHCWSRMDTDTLTHNHMTSKITSRLIFGSFLAGNCSTLKRKLNFYIVQMWVVLADAIPAATMPRCCGWLPEHCYSISGVLLVVARALLECTVWVNLSNHSTCQ